MITKEQLKAMMPYATTVNIDKYLNGINQTVVKYDISTSRRIAAFLAQLAHESGSLKYGVEIASGEAYEGRKDLGNTELGDGKRFKGRGLIQLTGRANYTAISKALGVDFVSTPSLLEKPEYSTLAAGWFWDRAKLNVLADKDDFKGITKKINGGLNGIDDRMKHWDRIKSVLNVT